MKEIILYLDPVSISNREFIKGLTPDRFDIMFARSDGGIDSDINFMEAHYLIVASAPLKRDYLEGFRNLKLIQKTGAGTENIDKEAAAALGIPVAITPGVNSPAVAELVILYILAMYRNLIELDRETKNGNWLMWEKRHQSFEFKGKEVGLIGFGRIGRELNRRLQSFDVKVSYFDLRRLEKQEEERLGIQYKTMEDILRGSDIISLHLPLDKSTSNLIGKEQLDMVKPNCLLINTSRGAIVDEEALTQALVSGKLAGAALDTFATEPIKADNPLLKLSNVITTPHIGAGTIDTWRSVLNCAFENIERVSRGYAPLYVVNGVNG